MVKFFHTDSKYSDLSYCKPKRACEVNFCRTFILSISLFLELSGFNLSRTKLYRIGYICKGMSASVKKWQLSE